MKTGTQRWGDVGHETLPSEAPGGKNEPVPHLHPPPRLHPALHWEASGSIWPWCKQIVPGLCMFRQTDQVSLSVFKKLLPSRPLEITIKSELNSRNFHGDPMFKTSPSNVGGTGSIPDWGAKIPCSQKTNTHTLIHTQTHTRTVILLQIQ